ncbi:TlyA family RNA methyltransferase [Bacillaceae bacterium S4-13-58]
MKKVRLDVLLVEKGLVETREKAKRAIMAGLVFHKSERLDKPGLKVDEDILLEVKGKPIPYVSRGGLKLEKAIGVFNLSLKDEIVLDIGSSTGGFTDCALQNGAKLSYAVDVGYNQLDWKIRNDPRVIVMERTNFRYLEEEALTHETPTFASIDVSFISLRLIFPTLAKLIADGGQVVALVKPQFEAGREQVGKKGIVRDPDIHREVIENVIRMAISNHFSVKGLTYSPITGGDGNIEFLLHLSFHSEKEGNIESNVEIEHVVRKAHNELSNKGKGLS